MGTVKKITRMGTAAVNQIVKYACVVFFSVMVVEVIVYVVMRYILIKPMVWSEQLAVYCMIWIAFLSSSIGFQKGAHMGLDLLVKNAPPKISKIMSAVAHLMIISFLVVFTIWGFAHAFAVRHQTSPVVFNMSMIWAYIALPVGGVFMLIQELGVIINGVEEDT